MVSYERCHNCFDCDKELFAMSVEFTSKIGTGNIVQAACKDRRSFVEAKQKQHKLVAAQVAILFWPKLYYLRYMGKTRYKLKAKPFYDVKKFKINFRKNFKTYFNAARIETQVDSK